MITKIEFFGHYTVTRCLLAFTYILQFFYFGSGAIYFHGRNIGSCIDWLSSLKQQGILAVSRLAHCCKSNRLLVPSFPSHLLSLGISNINALQQAFYVAIHLCSLSDFSAITLTTFENSTG